MSELRPQTPIEVGQNPVDSQNTQYWIGRPVLDSERLTEKLAQLCGIESLVTTDRRQLVFPMMRRHAMPHAESQLDVDEALDDFTKDAGPFVLADKKLELPIDRNNTKPLITNVRHPSKVPKNQIPRFKKVAIPLKDGHGFKRLHEEYLALNKAFDADEFHRIPMSLRIVESTGPEKARKALDMIYESGLFQSTVDLGPLSVCSSTKCSS